VELGEPGGERRGQLHRADVRAPEAAVRRFACKPGRPSSPGCPSQVGEWVSNAAPGRPAITAPAARPAPRRRRWSTGWWRVPARRCPRLLGRICSFPGP
jgi:hypothetical protein